MEQNTIRAFVAIETSAEVRRRLAEVQADLSKAAAQVKWVNPETIHLTLAFLGDISPEQAGLASAALDELVRGRQGFSYDVEGTGFFGSPRAPRTVWAGVSASVTLMGIEKELRTPLRALDIPVEDRPFKPHLTLGRVRSPKNADTLAKRMEPFATARFGSVEARHLLLIRSTLTPAGPIHATIHSAPLGQSPAAPAREETA